MPLSKLPGYTVLLPIYAPDPAEFAASLDSLWAQTLPPGEVLLVNDGPISPELQAVLDEHQAAHPELRLVNLPEAKGLGAALGEGIPLAKYELIGRMDADDLALPERFERQVRFLEEHPDIDMCCTTILEFEDSPDNVVAMREVPADPAALRKFANRWSPMNHGATMYRRAAVLLAGNYQHFERHEDYYLWVRMLMSGTKAASLTEPLMLVRIGFANLNRRRSWAATVSAIRFHLWKRRVGFAGWYETCVMIGVMIGIFALPDRLFRWVYLRRRPPTLAVG
ncbi:MAG: glycosyltransferase [Promicromonosporaceae bacterium]|nr:glycosyltransferase [Promicromonosporaceae bacterium]